MILKQERVIHKVLLLTIIYACDFSKEPIEGDKHP